VSGVVLLLNSRKDGITQSQERPLGALEYVKERTLRDYFGDEDE
jgi:hypothetical protein